MEIRVRVSSPLSGEGFLLLDLPQGWGGWRREKDADFLSKAGGVRATLDSTDCPVRIVSRGSRLSIVTVHLGQPARAGSTLRVLLPPLLPCDRPGRYGFHVLAGDGTREPVLLPSPTLTVRPGPFAGWDLVAPSSAEPGTPFSIHLRPHAGPLSSYATVPADESASPVPATVAEGVRGLSIRPEAATGMDGLTLTAPHARLRLAGRGEECDGASHPLVSTSLTGGLHVFFGDLHLHTGESDGMGSPEKAYRWARDGAGLDFVALNDHVEDRLRYAPSSWGRGEWQALFDAADAFEDPGHFATIPGVELAGSVNVYFRERGVPYRDLHELDGDPQRILRYLDDASRDQRILFGYHKLAELEEYYLKGPPPALVEIIQHKRPPEEGLGRILPLCPRPPAFTGSTDSHQGLAGAPPMGFGREESQYGLTGVLAREKTRAAIFSALAHGRTFATSGQRSILLLGLNGAVPGDTVDVRTDRRATASVRVWACRPVQSIELLVDGRAIWSDAPMEETVTRSVDVTDLLGPASGRAAAYLYARICEADGRMAWSSPIGLAPERGSRRGLPPRLRG